MGIFDYLDEHLFCCFFIGSSSSVGSVQTYVPNNNKYLSKLIVEISSNIAKGVNLWGARDLGKAGLVPPRQGTGEDWVRISFLLNFEEKVRRTCIFVHFCAYICLIKPISGILCAFILSAMSSDLRKYHFANQVWLTDYGSISQIRKNSSEPKKGFGYWEWQTSSYLVI